MAWLLQGNACVGGSFVGELLQKELDAAHVPAHVRYRIQLALSTDATMDRLCKEEGTCAQPATHPRPPEQDGNPSKHERARKKGRWDQNLDVRDSLVIIRRQPGPL